MGLFSRFNKIKRLNAIRSKTMNQGLAKALEAEEAVAEAMLNHPSIAHVFVGRRVPDPDKKLAKGECDVLAISEDGSVFIIEVKFWAGLVTEVHGDIQQERLAQAGRSKPVIAKLEKKAGFLRRYLSAATNEKWTNIHPLVVLANQNTEPTKSVMGLKQVATMQTLAEKIDTLVNEESDNSKNKIKSIVEEIDKFNRFDSLSYEGGNITSGDIVNLPWPRDKYQSISISVERGLLKTLFFGPKYRVTGFLWNGAKEDLEIDPEQTFVEFNVPWNWKKRNFIPLSHLSEIRYGGCTVSEVTNLSLLQSNNSSNLESNKQSTSSTGTIYSKGQKLYDRKVLRHLVENGKTHGLLIELRPKERPGLMNISMLGSINNSMFNYFYKEGNTIDVEVVKVRKNGDILLGPINNGDE